MNQHLTPAEIVDHFPFIRKRFTAREIGYLAMLELVPYKYMNRKKKIKPADIIKLMDCICKI